MRWSWRNGTKDEILEAYLNEVFFGRRCYGVVTASKKYFNKDVSELTLAESASLVAITNNPSRFDPMRNDWTRENNRERQLLVLEAMLEQGKIDEATYGEAAKNEDVVFADGYTISGKYVGSDPEKLNHTEDTTDEPDTDTVAEEEEENLLPAENSWFTDAMIDDVAEALVEKLGLTEKVDSDGKTVSAYKQAINMVYGKGL